MECRANDLPLWSNNFKIELKRPSLFSEGGEKKTILVLHAEDHQPSEEWHGLQIAASKIVWVKANLNIFSLHLFKHTLSIMSVVYLFPESLSGIIITCSEVA